MKNAVHDGRRLIGAGVRALVIGALALSFVACSKPDVEAERAAAAPSPATDTTASSDSAPVGPAAADTGWTETGQQIVGEFVPASGGSPRIVQTLAEGGRDPGFDEFPELIATVGPYAFIFVRTFEAPCGAAHPGRRVDFHVLDLTSGRSLEPLDLLDVGERERWIRELGSRAVTAFRARETERPETRL